MQLDDPVQIIPFPWTSSSLQVHDNKNTCFSWGCWNYYMKKKKKSTKGLLGFQ